MAYGLWKHSFLILSDLGLGNSDRDVFWGEKSSKLIEFLFRKPTLKFWDEMIVDLNLTLFTGGHHEETATVKGNCSEIWDELLVGRYDAWEVRICFPQLAGWSPLKSVTFPKIFASREPPFPQVPTTFSYGEDCVWGAWSDWGDCSKCGGQRYRQRSVIKMPNVSWCFCLASGKGRWCFWGLVFTV